ncbi:MAG: glycosyltransferase [Deltaproteobacteria bacterium]|jgi:glycosyltransferase involved in cell wall biosynthesis|nr:glycosyltransferase [Deltaproteobacteria bacterium]
MNKNILMICYYYPPLTDVGCKRSVFFAKYFKEYGWNPFVLSVKNPDTTYCSLGTDTPPKGIPVTYSLSLFSLYKFFGKLNALLYRLLKVFRIELKKNYFFEFLCVPDIFTGWVPMAIVNGLKLIKKHDIDLIYVSITPLSSAMIGWWLKKITGKPLVLDYRDPFGVDLTKYQPHFVDGWFRSHVDRWYANAMLRSCDMLTVTTRETEQLYRDQYPFVNEKIHTIYNGFDHRFLDQLQPENKFEKFTIIYTGEFYYPIEYEYFFAGLDLLKKQGSITGDNFQFLFYGGNISDLKHILAKYDIKDLVALRQRIPYVEVLREIQKSHLQLLRIMQPMISTKLFEGIPLNIPFLATIPEGEVEQIIRKYSPSSFVVTEKRPEPVAESIVNAMQQYRDGKIADNHVSEFLSSFSRAKSAKNMLALMENLLPSK